MTQYKQQESRDFVTILWVGIADKAYKLISMAISGT